MLTGYNAVGYAQSGYNYSKGQVQANTNFAQDGIGDTPTDSNFTMDQVTTGSVQTYATVDNLYDYLVMTVNGTVLLTSSFQAHKKWPGPSYGVQLLGEVSDNGTYCQSTCGDDQPGTANASMGQTDLKIWNGSSWTTNLPPLQGKNDNASRWSYSALGTCLDGLPCFASWTSNPG